MAKFFQQLVNDLSIGNTYALIVLGYTMVYGITKLIDLAHGDIYMLGAYVGFISIAQLHLGSFLALLLTMVVYDVLDVIIEHIAHKPLRSATRVTTLVTITGASYFLRYSTQKIVGPGVKTYSSVLSNRTFHVFDIQIQMQQIYILTIAIVLMLTLQSIVRKTKIGHSMHAISVNADAVKLVGINVNVTISYTSVIGSALAGAGGVLVGTYYNVINPLMGIVPGIRVFVAAVFNGTGTIPGVMFSGLFVGIVEALATAYESSLYKDATICAILILILVIKSAGSLGKNVREKV